MIGYLFLSYALGNLMTAWLVGKIYGIDLREERSGNLGARNAGAVLGKRAFVLTFLGDAGKAALAVFLGAYWGFGLQGAALGAMMVILGHLFPVVLKGRGGKGVAAFIGAAFMLHLPLFGVLVGSFLIVAGMIRSATLALPFALLAYAFAIAWGGYLPVFWPMCIGAGLVLFRHWADLRESLQLKLAPFRK